MKESCESCLNSLIMNGRLYCSRIKKYNTFDGHCSYYIANERIVDLKEKLEMANDTISDLINENDKLSESVKLFSNEYEKRLELEDENKKLKEEINKLKLFNEITIYVGQNSFNILENRIKDLKQLTCEKCKLTRMDFLCRSKDNFCIAHKGLEFTIGNLEEKIIDVINKKGENINE